MTQFTMNLAYDLFHSDHNKIKEELTGGRMRPPLIRRILVGKM
jgi:hypothetical protein